jgi:hypothetical protein
MRVRPQGVGQDPGVAPVVLGPGDRAPVAEAVELFGFDGVHGESALEQGLDHGAVRRLDRDVDRPGRGAGRSTSQLQSIAKPSPPWAKARSLAISPEASICLPSRARAAATSVPIPVQALGGASPHWASRRGQPAGAHVPSGCSEPGWTAVLPAGRPVGGC